MKLNLISENEFKFNNNKNYYVLVIDNKANETREKNMIILIPTIE
jgi:hypothetical protein